MQLPLKYFFFILWISGTQHIYSQDAWVTVTGKVTSADSNLAIPGVGVKLSQSYFSTSAGKDGSFTLKLPPRSHYKILFSHLSYESITKEINSHGNDTVFLSVKLKIKSYSLSEVNISAYVKPETLVGKPSFSIYDFDFLEDRFLLLTAPNSLKKATVKLSDLEGKITADFEVPKSAGEALYFYRDYEGYTDLVCRDSVFRFDVLAADLIVRPIKKADFNRYLLPVSDTAFSNFYLSDQWEKYPSFNHYVMQLGDTVAKLLKNVTNKDLMDLYNFEYYFLPSRMQLEARRLAAEHKTDVHVVAALMSGFTQSMYYESLYAPLFILNDTICIFNHHNNFLYHFDKNNKLLDSVPIHYHHPKNWRHWKKQLLVDEAQNSVYAFFSKDGHHYLKRIDYKTGKEVLTYKLQNYSGRRIKIKDGYAYYTYKPVDSTQEFFLYRELIR